MKIELYLERDGEWKGPYSPAELKTKAENGEVGPNDLIRKFENGKPIPASKVKGLLPPPPATTLILDRAKPAAAAIFKGASVVAKGTWTGLTRVKRTLVVPKSKPTELTAPQTTPKFEVAAPRPMTELERFTDCPHCGETVLKTATKCKHCGEFLEARPKRLALTTLIAPVINISNVNAAIPGDRYSSRPIKRWSRLMAFFLSLLVPGLGQLYKGQAVKGFVWFVLVIIGYICFIIPGIVLHLCCVLGAASGDPGSGPMKSFRLSSSNPKSAAPMTPPAATHFCRKCKRPVIPAGNPAKFKTLACPFCGGKETIERLETALATSPGVLPFRPTCPKCGSVDVVMKGTRITGATAKKALLASLILLPLAPVILGVAGNAEGSVMQYKCSKCRTKFDREF